MEVASFLLSQQMVIVRLEDSGRSGEEFGYGAGLGVAS